MCMCTYRYYKELHISSSSELGAQKSCLKSFLVTRIMKILPTHDSSNHNAQLTKPILIFFSHSVCRGNVNRIPKASSECIVVCLQRKYLVFLVSSLQSSQIQV